MFSKYYKTTIFIYRSTLKYDLFKDVTYSQKVINLNMKHKLMNLTYEEPLSKA